MQIPASALFAHRQMLLHQSTMAKALQRLSSGYRINSAKDDPAGLAISERMRAQITGLNQAVENAKNGLGMVNVADGSLGSVTSGLQRLVDLGMQASNGTLTDADRHNLQQEAKQLLEGIRATAGNSKYAGQQLLDTVKDVSLQVGATDNAYDKLALKMPGLQDALKMLDSFDLSTQTSAQASLELAREALDTVNGLRGNLGAQANRLEHTINNLENTAGILTEAESRIRDADMAKEMVNYVRAKALSQVAQIAMVHAMEEPKRTLEMVKSGL